MITVASLPLAGVATVAAASVQATTGGLLQGLSDDALAVQQAISEKVNRAPVILPVCLNALTAIVRPPALQMRMLTPLLSCK
jgi:hypothetical protein